MDATATHLGFRKLGRGWYAGILITLVIHVLIAGMAYLSQVKSAPREEAVRDMMVMEVVRFATPRPKYYLPRIVQPPQPVIEQPVIKIAEDPNAAPAPKEAPKPEDAKIDPKLRRALERAQMLKRAAAEEEETDGSLTGSKDSTASQTTQGDEYGGIVLAAIRRNWSTPAGLLNDTELKSLVADISVRIDDDGSVLEPRLRKSSGNQLYDDSCMQAIKATNKVTPPPPANRRAFWRRGVIIGFEGSDMSR